VTMTKRRATGVDEHSVSQLVNQASGQLSDLVRQEMRLAMAEVSDKGKRAGIGGGLFGVAGIAALVAFLAFATAAIAAFSLILPVWAAALVVAGCLLLIAGVMALAGKAEFSRAKPAVPKAAIDSVKADVHELKERAHR
jgi:Flp pilus assembly protein TadB